jgi:hypothetical protein
MKNLQIFIFFFAKIIVFEKGDPDSLMPVSRNQMLIFGINDPHPGMDRNHDPHSENFHMR